MPLFSFFCLGLRGLCSLSSSSGVLSNGRAHWADMDKNTEPLGGPHGMRHVEGLAWHSIFIFIMITVVILVTSTAALRSTCPSTGESAQQKCRGNWVYDTEWLVQRRWKRVGREGWEAGKRVGEGLTLLASQSPALPLPATGPPWGLTSCQTGPPSWLAWPLVSLWPSSLYPPLALLLLTWSDCLWPWPKLSSQTRFQVLVLLHPFDRSGNPGPHEGPWFVLDPTVRQGQDADYSLPHPKPTLLALSGKRGCLGVGWTPRV